MSSRTLTHAFAHNFLGQAPNWYKAAIVLFLVINPIILTVAGPFVAGWVLLIEFIFTLAMALKCYPLQPGGLLAIQAIVLGMASPVSVYKETLGNFKVILLLMFMVAGIFFMKDLLLYVFTKILLKVKSKKLLSFLFSIMAAILSAFLDALTVIAVLISVAGGFYHVYHKVISSKEYQDSHEDEQDKRDLTEFRNFLSNLLMHGAVGTALGGVCTIVGEPQNLLIAEKAGWDFITFFTQMMPITMPVLAAGLLTCVLLETFKIFGYGAQLPAEVAKILQNYDQEQQQKRTKDDNAKLVIQALVMIFLVVALITHSIHHTEVGLIGLAVIVLVTSFNGIIHEHSLGHAFEEALPFTALLVVFFAIVAVIHEQHLFSPITQHILAMDVSKQPSMFFVANGLLSMISDNVFVATVYIDEARKAFDAGQISRELFDKLAIAINTGTNIPSVATPNGQAAFLFLLTSAVAPLLRLSYGRMVWMALPYTIVMSGVALAAVIYYL